jgi:hypothetical protein
MIESRNFMGEPVTTISEHEICYSLIEGYRARKRKYFSAPDYHVTDLPELFRAESVRGDYTIEYRFTSVKDY